MTTTYAFDTDTASARVGDHEYGLELSDRWSTLAAP